MVIADLIAIPHIRYALDNVNISLGKLYSRSIYLLKWPIKRM